MPTIGVALAIPEPWASELQDYRTSIGDTTATTIPTHITLVPPTEVGEDDLVDVEKHLAEVAAASPRFVVHLRGTGTFRPVSPVVFVTVAEGISSCEQLANTVRRGPLDVDIAFPYHPHVTVAHGISEEAMDRAHAELADFEASWTATGFALYTQGADCVWRMQREFPFADFQPMASFPQQAGLSRPPAASR